MRQMILINRVMVMVLWSAGKDIVAEILVNDTNSSPQMNGGKIC